MLKSIFSFFKRIFRTKKSYGFKSLSYKYTPYNNLEQLFESQPKDLFSNCAILIPQEAYKPVEIVEDPRGAPIYAPCPANGLCACTGACRRIIDYTKDPTKLEAHREYIRKYNELQKTGLQHLYGEGKWDSDSKI